MSKKPIAIGSVFDRLTVIENLGVIDVNVFARRSYLCTCICNNIVKVKGSHLTGLRTRSCGCLRLELVGARFRTHGESSIKTKNYLYRLWSGIKDRCDCITDRAYSKYGGRGIKMYENWRFDYVDFKCWILDNLGDRPHKHSLDRINNDGNYEPGNLRWATAETQNNNTRVSRAIVQKTLQGEYVALHTSLAAAQRSVGKGKSHHIHRCVDRPDKYCYGYLWESVK